MLERAIRCLKLRAQGSWRFPPKVRPNRRMLHSAFWRHGAGDLDLPTWCFSTVRNLFEPDLLLGQGDLDQCSRWSNSSIVPEKYFLDFLYPRGTKATIKRLSMYGLRRWYRHLRAWRGESRKRLFASVSNQDETVVQSKTASVPQDRAVTPVNATNTSSEGLIKSLDDYMLRSSHSSSENPWNEVWRMFSAVSESARTPRLMRDVINYLSTSPRTMDSRRIVRIFDRLPATEVHSSTATIVIYALLRLKEAGKAVMVHDAAPKNTASLTPGADVLLAHCIGYCHWQLAFHVWRKCLEPQTLRGDSEGFKSWRAALIRKLVTIPGLPEKLLSLLNFLEEYREILQPAPSVCGQLVSELVSAVFSSGGSLGDRQVLRTLATMRNFNLSTPLLYEPACAQALRTTESTPKQRVSLALEIYNAYRQDPSFRPSHWLLFMLFRAVAEEGRIPMMKLLLSDWQTVYGVPSLKFSGIIMKGFASVGDKDMVEATLSQCLTQYGERSPRLFTPRLHVHAMRAEPDLVWEQMNRMSELGIEPDIVCWNVLLHAYARVADMDGALSTLSHILQIGLEPDHYSIAAVMSVCAERGDVDLIQQLLDIAADHNLPKSDIIMNTFVLALINNDDLEGAKRLVLKESPGRNAVSNTRMWNQLLAAYAVLGDFDNVTIVSKEMQKLQVPFDAMTYAALMRVYTVRRQSDIARRILFKVLPKTKIKILPIHYAIVINGLADELLFEKAIRVHAAMLANEIQPALSTQMALLKVHTLATRHKTRMDSTQHAGVRFDIPEETLEEFLSKYDRKLLANRDPRLTSKKISLADAYPAAYFDILLSIYGRARGYDAVRALLQKYEAEMDADGQGREPSRSLHILCIIMNIQYRQRDMKQLERYWQLSKETATKLATRAGGTTARGELPRTQRYLLSRHLDLYMRALAAENKFHKMYEIFGEIFSLGFDLDNRNWNWYVQVLATERHYVEAFVHCEQHLMQNWPGWRSTVKPPRYKERMRRRFFGTKLLADVPSNLGTYGLSAMRGGLAPGQLLPTYKTMVRLAFSIRVLTEKADVRRAARDELDEIRRKAPKTVEAVLAMPMKEYPEATALLGYSPGNFERKQLPVV